MPQISFYHLTNPEPDSRLQFACRLAEKARRLGHRLFLQAADKQEAERLSDLLWAFKPAAFLPHSLLADNADGDCDIAVGMQRQLQFHSDVLINLSGQPCHSHEQFQRINEIICQDQDILAAGRNCYRYYQSQGYQPETHKL